MKMLKNYTFNDFCIKYLDRIYTPKLSDEEQSTGYLQLKKMIKEGITPASKEEINRWENTPTVEELTSAPDIKYLRFLHPLTRAYVIEYWDTIKMLKL